MTPAPDLPGAARIYLRCVIAFGLLAITESLFRLYRAPVEPRWLLLAALTLISGSASVKLPGAHVSISISEAFVFTAVLLYGSAAGTITVALDGLVISYWIARRRPELDRALFNISAPAVSAWCSSHLFFYCSGIAPLVDRPASLDAILPALVVFALTYFLLNSWLIAGVIAIEKHLTPWRVWRTGFVWLSLNYFCGASVAILLVGYNRTVDVRFVGVIVPLLLVLYFTFKTSMERVEDANKHVEQINTLFLSTIETLAMAIDAKDQITHGHIRRVQTFAVGLSRHIGITDPGSIKAIEAAALLHDMGKIAVPEYILNKPGKLTPMEFERMKLHATVGADILSAIPFPYPVVPIVRHHHENWDGSGYPHGLKGTDIPIGARILSVVDCFDALTSDRPYRSRLSDAEALAILVERRGSMYDPLIVDAFIKFHAELSISVHVQRSPTEPFNGMNSVQSLGSPAMTSDISTSREERHVLPLPDLVSALAGPTGLVQTSIKVAQYIQEWIPSSVVVFYLHDADTSELVASHCTGDGESRISGLRMSIGHRVTGWVAANRQTIVNADAVLDLGDVARQYSPRLQSCLSTPLLFNEKLVGAITLYSAVPNAYSESNRHVLEFVALQIAAVMAQAVGFDGPRSAELEPRDTQSRVH